MKKKKVVGKPKVLLSSGLRVERIKSGTKNFDALIEGGLEKNSTNLIIGGSGTGKTIFGVQFLAEGMKNNEACLYISFEERKDAFYANFMEMGIDLTFFEKKGLFYFLEYTPQKVRSMIEEGGGAIEATVLTKDIKRIVIDSISSFTLLFDKELEKKETALALFTLLKGWNCTTILIADEDSIGENESSKMINQEADSIIHLYYKKGLKKRERFLEILKMRGTNHSMEVQKFEITNKGFVVLSSVRKDKNIFLSEEG